MTLDLIREAERKGRWDHWVTDLEKASVRVGNVGMVVGLGGMALGAVLDWLFDWKWLMYAGGFFAIACYLDSMVKSLEAQRRRFLLSILAPLEETVDRIERRLERENK